jgi:hypothetical protein
MVAVSKQAVVGLKTHVPVLPTSGSQSVFWKLEGIRWRR